MGGARSRVSPMPTKIGTCTFSYVRESVASFLFVLPLNDSKSKKITCGYVLVCFLGFFSFVFMSSHSHFSITLYHAFLKALVRSTVAVYNSSLVLRGRFSCPCRQNNGGIGATSNRDTGRLSPISWHTRQPVLPISISHQNSCTWRDECRAACPFFSSQLIAN